MRNNSELADTEEKPDELVPDPRVGDEFGVGRMALYRWDHDPRMAALGWPPPVRIRNKKYRPRRNLERFKKRLIAQSVKEARAAR